MKLLFDGSNLSTLKTSNGICVTSYQHCIAQTICNPPRPICYLGECDECPGHASVEALLHKIFDDNMIELITFKQWVSVDQSTLDSVAKSADDFTAYFIERLLALIPHTFIASQQASYYKQRKMSLACGEIVIQADLFFYCSRCCTRVPLE